MPFTLAGPVRMPSPVHHANRTDDVRYGRNKSSLNICQTEILHDLWEEEANPPLWCEDTKIDDAECQDARAYHRLEPSHVEEHFTVSSLRVQAIFHPFALIGFDPRRHQCSIGHILYTDQYH